MNHKCITHTDCEDPGCPICSGGLCTCEICGGSEGELTTDCPGIRLTYQQKERVMNRELDYRDGQWHYYNT